jgi:hypothetical protein
MPAVWQDVVSSQAGNAEDLSDLQDHSLGHAKEGEQSSMTNHQSLAARKYEERKLGQREAAAQLAEVPATKEN